MRVILTMCCVTMLAGPVAGEPLRQAVTAGSLCQAAISSAERRTQVATGLLGAIGVVESGRPDPASGVRQPWPWTVNAEGTGAFYATKAEAVEAVRGLQARGVTSIDVGCMQVNLRHHPTAFTSLEEAFDPAANADYAAVFVTQLYRRLGGWDVAVAAYHSMTPERGAEYGRRIAAAWTGASGPAWPSPAERLRRSVASAWGATVETQGGEWKITSMAASQGRPLLRQETAAVLQGSQDPRRRLPRVEQVVTRSRPGIVVQLNPPPLPRSRI